MTIQRLMQKLLLPGNTLANFMNMDTTTLQEHTRKPNGSYSVMVEYVHQLNEDIQPENWVRAGVTLRVTSTPDKLESYSVFSGTGFLTITPDKVRILKRTTTIETMLLDEHP